MIEDNMLMFNASNEIEYRITFKNCYFVVDCRGDMGFKKELEFYRYDEVKGMSLNINPNQSPTQETQEGYFIMIVKWDQEEPFYIESEDYRPLEVLQKELQGRIDRALFNSNQGR